jgi:1-phosphofructokinase family hexose kinase
MIVTVTLNPLLERRYSFKEYQYHGINRDGKLILAAGGKGINVSRQLNHLDIQNLAFIPLGGRNGKTIRNILKEEVINFTSINIKSETRDGVVIIDEKNEKVVTSLIGTNHEITEEEVGIFKEKLEKIIQNCEIVIFSGSSPGAAADSIFPFGIETANRLDKVSFCDTYGNHLAGCIKAGPTILHNNLEEITKSLGTKLDSEESILSFLNQLYSNGIKQSYLTNGSEAFYASNFDFHFKIKPPIVKSINPTGSGDSFSAGIIYGWYKDLTFEDALKLGTSLGAVNAARFDVCKVSLPESDEFLPRVEVEAIGKKMKLLDVTPR